LLTLQIDAGVKDATRAGISEQELEDAVGGDLVSNMLEALDAAAERAIEEATSRGNPE
jgi:hypothetical protein